MKKRFTFFLTLFATCMIIGLIACEKEPDPDSTPTPTPTPTPEDTTIAVTGIALNESAIKMSVGENKTLIATVSPANATNQNVVWVSSDIEIASVSNGVVSALKEGIVTISVKSLDGSFWASCNVTITVAVTGVSLNRESVEINEGSTISLVASVLPENATNKNVRWSSSDSSVVSVSDGLVSSHKIGSAQITVTTEDGGFSANCTVEVTNRTFPVDSITLNKTDIELAVNKETELIAMIFPDNATNKNIIWEISDPEIASLIPTDISQHIIIKGLKPGTAQITATTEDGNKTATCSLVIPVPVTGISVTPKSVEMILGTTINLTATVYPENASNNNVTWTSANSKVVTVDNDGVITGAHMGSTYIYATTEDGGYVDHSYVVVREMLYHVDSLTLDKTNIEVVEGDVFELIATIHPKNASDRNMSWTSSDPEVAYTVGRSDYRNIRCWVYTKKPGTAQISAITNDGGKTATCSVVVNKGYVPVTRITLDKLTMYLNKGETGILTPTIYPEDATDKSVNWSIDDPSIATVDNGKVTALEYGSTVVYARSHDNKHFDYCYIIVRKPEQE